MADSCTIYSSQDDRLAAVCDALQALGCRLEIIGPKAKWQRLIVRNGALVLTLTSLFRGVPQDRFSLMILGTHNAVRMLKNVEEADMRAFAHRVLETKVIVGVVGDPSFDEFAADCITTVARALDGFVFNGQEFMNANGEYILGGPQN